MIHPNELRKGMTLRYRPAVGLGFKQGVVTKINKMALSTYAFIGTTRLYWNRRDMTWYESETTD